ncbi:MAG: DMT family transporter [Promethearchaeota archaeon]|nr:MAG: DMT family transporter [Candidatus Lokiarchaeota archaeon]
MAELIGYILAVDAIITWALASLVYKKGLDKTDPKGTLLFRLSCVSLFTLILSMIIGNFLIFLTLEHNELIFYLFMCLASGLTVTIGDMCYFASLKKIDASRAYPLTQLSLIFVYPFSIIFFGEKLTLSIIIGGTLILSSVFLLSKKDKEDIEEEGADKDTENVLVGILLAIGTAFFWALAIVSFHQARIISGDVFVTNFIRIIFATSSILILGIFKREYYSGFKWENREELKYNAFMGIAGSLSLGLADSLFYQAAEINGLILTSTITANTPMVQQIFSIAFLKEKFRKRFVIACMLIIIGNYIILFL